MTAFETFFRTLPAVQALLAEFDATQARRNAHNANGNERGERACMRKEAELQSEWERLYIATRMPA